MYLETTLGMFANFIITFRETLEAALVVGIVLSYLHRTKARHYRPLVWWGVAVGLAASVVGAIVFSRLTSRGSPAGPKSCSKASPCLRAPSS